MKLSDLPTEKVSISDIPFYHKRGAENGNTYVRFGNVKRGGNEPYCYTEEKQCQGRICRVLIPDAVIDKAMVIRDDGTVWNIWLSNFQEVHLLKIRR